MTVVLLKILKSNFVKQNHMLGLKTKHVTINHTLSVQHVECERQHSVMGQREHWSQHISTLDDLCDLKSVSFNYTSVK